MSYNLEQREYFRSRNLEILERPLRFAIIFFLIPFETWTIISSSPQAQSSLFVSWHPRAFRLPRERESARESERASAFGQSCCRFRSHLTFVASLSNCPCSKVRFSFFQFRQQSVPFSTTSIFYEIFPSQRNGTSSNLAYSDVSASLISIV